MMDTIKTANRTRLEDSYKGAIIMCIKISIILTIYSLTMLFVSPPNSNAHNLWINISSHFIQPGDKVKAYLGWGHHYPFSDFLPPNRLDSMTVLRPDGIIIPVPTVNKNREPGIPIKIDQEGVYIVGAAIKPGYYTETSHGHTFKSKKESKDVINSIWYEKYAKAIICSGSALKGAYVKPLGHAIEIISLGNPCKVKPGENLKVKVLLNGRPLEGAFLYKSYLGQPSNKVLSCPQKTDKNGIAEIHFENEGIWRIMVKQKEPPLDPTLCDNRIYTAFLTIAVRK